MIDNVNSPSHYTHGNIECIDIIAEMVRDKSGMESACVANITKYLYRYKGKGGIESVKKAQWYLNRLIQELEGQETGDHKDPNHYDLGGSDGKEQITPSGSWS